MHVFGGAQGGAGFSMGMQVRACWTCPGLEWLASWLSRLLCLCTQGSYNPLISASSGFGGLGAIGNDQYGVHLHDL